MSLSWLSGGFLAGLSTGAACVGICGSVLLPLILGHARSVAANVRIFLLFSLGRLIAYVLFGAAVGWLGAQITALPGRGFLAPAASMLAAILLLRWLLRRPVCGDHPCATAHVRHQLPFVLGFATGINPCPPFVSAALIAASAGSVCRGASYFLVFFLGTTVAIAPLPVAGLLTRWHLVTRIGRLAGVAVGMVYLLSALAGFNSLLQPQTAADLETRYRAVCPEGREFVRVSHTRILAYTNVTASFAATPFAVITDSSGLRDHQPIGYAGATPILLACNATGIIAAVSIGENEESPRQFAQVTNTAWWRGLVGAPVEQAGEPVDSVSGATLSSEALHATIAALAQENLQDTELRPAARQTWRGAGTLPFVALALTAVLLARWPAGRKPAVRWGLWLASVGLLGFARPTYFSIAQVGAAIHGAMPPVTNIAWHAVFWFALVSPVLWGRVYCQHLCPFGVLSDLLGRLVPWRIALAPGFVSIARWIKTGLLAAAVVMAVTGAEFALERFEPFHGVFFRRLTAPYVVFCFAVLAVSCVVKRFWCALFCLDGALFQLISRFRVHAPPQEPKEEAQ